MATGTSLFQEVNRCRRKVFNRQGMEEPRMLQGDWRKDVCMLETTLRRQSQTIKQWMPVLSFLRMLMPAHRLMAKVTRLIGMFAKRYALAFATFTWIVNFLATSTVA